MTELHVQILPALGDNYIFLLSRGKDAMVVDPAEAEPVLREVRERGLNLTDILVTHHHADHTGGVKAIKRRTQCSVWGPDDRRVPELDNPVVDNEGFEALGSSWTALYVPGHTRSHMAYSSLDDSIVFTGDTLFVGGCGRLFEGDAEQMWRSLRRLSSLPENTLVYCAHEYTEENYRFACTVAPAEEAYARRLEEVRTLLASVRPTVPSTISQELATNVFLRAGSAEGFAGLRKLKNSF